jgi:hypothetical protein
MTSVATILDDQELSNLVRGDWRLRKASSDRCELGVICSWQRHRRICANGSTWSADRSFCTSRCNSICIRRKLEDQLVRAIRSGKVEGDGRVRTHWLKPCRNPLTPTYS